MTVLTLNCGSSSLKYAVFDGEITIRRGTIDRIGVGGPSDHGAAVATALEQVAGVPIAAVGHRIVHGGPLHCEPERITDALLASLESVIPFAPLHLPMELRAITAVRERFTNLPQVVCFDTAFHRTMPEVARRYAIPRALFDAGIHRYGFHGLSYELVVSTLDPKPPRAVIAHLGNGASMVAIRDGVSIDTTMGFTPAAGLVMGTRSGDIDPGLVVYLFERCGYDAKRFEHLVNHESGLCALSETTSDMKQLLEARDTDARAALAVDVFCYTAAKWVGALATTLGGIDALIFTGGIGEHAPAIRAGVCRTLDYLGIALDEARNRASEPIISADGTRCTVRVIGTDEERIIARHTRDILAVL